MSILKNAKNYLPVTDDQDDLMASDMKYVVQAYSLIVKSAQNGLDVLQMSDGRIIIMELKPLMFEYIWNKDKGAFVRVQNGIKAKKPRKTTKQKVKNTEEA